MDDDLPYEGVKVLDLSQGIAGPYCAMPFKGKALKTLTRQKPFALVNPN